MSELLNMAKLPCSEDRGVGKPKAKQKGRGHAVQCHAARKRGWQQARRENFQPVINGGTANGWLDMKLASTWCGEATTYKGLT